VFSMKNDAIAIMTIAIIVIRIADLFILLCSLLGLSIFWGMGWGLVGPRSLIPIS
jgi:hypothetical protein